MMARVTLRLDFDGARRIGHGKIALLEAIGREGSISAAGRAHGMSYRRAWTLVEELNAMFREPLVVARNGGRNGGGAGLTDQGQRLVDLYRQAERRLAEAMAKGLRDLECGLAPPADGEVG